MIPYGQMIQLGVETTYLEIKSGHQEKMKKTCYMYARINKDEGVLITLIKLLHGYQIFEKKKKTKTKNEIRVLAKL